MQQPTSNELSHVHETTLEVATVELTPPHPAREDTPIYEATHKRMVYDLDTPCYVCGVTHTTLSDPTKNPFGAKAMETHHFPVERSLIDACDPIRLGIDFPAVTDATTAQNWVDSEDNMLVLCDKHHRDPEIGIHHLSAQDFFVQRYLVAGYQVTATAKDEAAIEAKDQSVEAQKS